MFSLYGFVESTHRFLNETSAGTRVFFVASIFSFLFSPPFSVRFVTETPSSHDEFHSTTRCSFANLVKTCLRSLVSVYELLRELGGYLPPKSIAPADITPLVSRLLRVNGAPLFDFFVDVDLYDRSRSSVFLDLPTKHQEDAFFAENPVSVAVHSVVRIYSVYCDVAV